MTMTRKIVIAAAALLLAACGGEKYAVPAAEATSMLAGLGTSPAITPMPAALSDVQVSFESLPGGNAVHWMFTLKGEDLGKIVATVEPDGEAGSTVAVGYVDPIMPVTSKTGSQYSAQIKGSVRQLLVEAVDSTLDRRPFDMALREQIDNAITIAMVGTMFQGASDGMNEAMARQDKVDRERDSQPDYSIEQPTTRDASQPTSDLRRFNN